MTDIKPQTKVLYDENPGVVDSVNRGSALVRWDHTGRRTIVSLSDLIPATDYEVSTQFNTGGQRPVSWDQVPHWISADRASYDSLHQAKWTKSTAVDQLYFSYWPDGSFMAQWVPEGVNIDWYDLPTWVKSPMSGDTLELAKKAIWSKEGDAYVAKLSDGYVLGRFSQE